MTRTTLIRYIKFLGIFIFAGLIIAFAVSRSLNYARGPEIEIFGPENGSTATSSTVTISGQALRINKLFLNGNTVSTDEQGYWNETLIIFPGLNKITVAATDQFNRKISKELDIVGTIDFNTQKNNETLSTGTTSIQ
ncbi:MAG: hypothetical protein NTZ38_02310 [Candidatus Taylorbacteria bacterium]|nr:hypothetical protein [Candidatus Taylorbacteria bacterium]